MIFIYISWYIYINIDWYIININWYVLYIARLGQYLNALGPQSAIWHINRPSMLYIMSGGCDVTAYQYGRKPHFPKSLLVAAIPYFSRLEWHNCISKHLCQIYQLHMRSQFWQHFYYAGRERKALQWTRRISSQNLSVRSPWAWKNRNCLQKKDFLLFLPMMSRKVKKVLYLKTP